MWQGTNMRTDFSRTETEQCWRGIWEKEATHNASVLWLRAVHGDFTEQESATITVADIEECQVRRAGQQRAWR